MLDSPPAPPAARLRDLNEGAKMKLDRECNRQAVLAAVVDLACAVLRTTRSQPGNRELEIQADFLLMRLCWSATELRPGPVSKYRAQRYCSIAVRPQLDQWHGPKGLRHDHVVEKRHLREALRAVRSENDVVQVVSAARACIVTPAEHARLGCSANRGWYRYVDAGISVWDRDEDRELNLEAAAEEQRRQFSWLIMR